MSHHETPRQQFIRSVRRSLGRSQPRRRPPDHPALQAHLPQQEQRVAAIRQRLASRQDELLDRLEHMASRATWRFTRARNEDEATAYILDLVAEQGVNKVARTAHPVLQRLPLDGRLTERGVQVVQATGGDDQSPTTLHQQLATVDMGITGVDYAIAETGSCVLLPRPGASRLASLLPPVYVAVVEIAQVVETLDDVLAFCRLAYLQPDGGFGSYMSFITGPSRTADIEQVIIIGAHGPRQAHMVVLTGP